MYPLTTRLWCTGLLLLNTLTIPILIPATCPEQPWRGARELRWGLQLGALGVATGAIAIGTVATSTSTTIIISIRTTISTATSTARDKVIGSTIRNIAGMRPMGIGAQRINLAAMLASSRAIAQAAALGTAPVPAERELVREVAVLEPATESLAIDQAAARALVIVRGAEPVLAIVLAEALVLIIDPAAAREPVIVPVVVRELVIVPAEVRELETVQVKAVPELETVQVAAELELRTVPVAEPETVQVEAVLVRSQPRAQLAVPPRTKSVTGPRRHDQVLLLTVEDLAAEVVETTRDPAVTEAAKAWEAAE